MFCTKCGKQQSNGERFCTNCGTPYGEGQSTGTISEPVSAVNQTINSQENQSVQAETNNTNQTYVQELETKKKWYSSAWVRWGAPMILLLIVGLVSQLFTEKLLEGTWHECTENSISAGAMQMNCTTESYTNYNSNKTFEEVGVMCISYTLNNREINYSVEYSTSGKWDAKHKKERSVSKLQSLQKNYNDLLFGDSEVSGLSDAERAEMDIDEMFKSLLPDSFGEVNYKVIKFNKNEMQLEDEDGSVVICTKE